MGKPPMKISSGDPCRLTVERRRRFPGLGHCRVACAGSRKIGPVRKFSRFSIQSRLHSCSSKCIRMLLCMYVFGRWRRPASGHQSGPKHALGVDVASAGAAGGMREDAGRATRRSFELPPSHFPYPSVSLALLTSAMLPYIIHLAST